MLSRTAFMAPRWQESNCPLFSSRRYWQPPQQTTRFAARAGWRPRSGPRCLRGRRRWRRGWPVAAACPLGRGPPATPTGLMGRIGQMGQMCPRERGPPPSPGRRFTAGAILDQCHIHASTAPAPHRDPTVISREGPGGCWPGGPDYTVMRLKPWKERASAFQAQIPG